MNVGEVIEALSELPKDMDMLIDSSPGSSSLMNLKTLYKIELIESDTGDKYVLLSPPEKKYDFSDN